MRKKILRKRDLYLNQMIAFQDTELIKVMTGIRRCGKSSLMKLMAEHLRENGVADDQILEMNFESMSIPEMDARGFYEYVKARICPDKRTYLLMRYRKYRAGKMPSILFGWILTAIFILRVPTPTCSPLSFPPICPGDMWKSRCYRYPSESFWIFMAIR